MQAPSNVAAGLVAITVPLGTATSGLGVVVALPAELAASSTPIQVTLGDGSPLPAWIRYTPEDNSLVIAAVPEGGFPIQLMAMVGNTRALLQISEDTAR